MAGSYQGAEVVTSRAREYAEGRPRILLWTCCLVLFLLFSAVQELQEVQQQSGPCILHGDLRYWIEGDLLRQQ